MKSLLVINKDESNYRMASLNCSHFSAIILLFQKEHDLYIYLCIQTSKPVELLDKPSITYLKRIMKFFSADFSEN